LPLSLAYSAGHAIASESGFRNGQLARSHMAPEHNKTQTVADTPAGKPKEEIIQPGTSSSEEPSSIIKPEGFSLAAFRSTKPAQVSNVATLLTGLPHHSMADAKDFVMLHPDEVAYWSEELCFINVPIQGQKKSTLHLIMEELAMKYLEPAQIQRFRLALATKPYDLFFLCHVPSQRLDNSWNETNLDGCLQAKTRWTQATSLKETGQEKYKISFSKDPDAFPQPTWPTQILDQLILVTFANCMIQRADHPALLRKIGAKQSLS
jgi:hypothetical protein